MEQPASTTPFAARTAWTRNLAGPVRDFLHAETSGAVVLLAATAAALAWANVAGASYESVWTTELAIRVGDTSLVQDLRHWVNDGLMALFFFVVGLEARREFDMGELRERRRIALPVVAGLGGMVVPVLVYLAVNAGRGTAGGWGVAMSTDTAFALGMLALVGRGATQRLRVFLLGVAVADDVAALLVIAFGYSEHVDAAWLAGGVGLFAVVLLLRRLGVRRGGAYALAGTAVWVAVFESGVDPVIVGLAMGLLTFAYPAARADLERATGLVRLFREQPTPRLARSARLGLDWAISPNERLQHLFHPWTSFLIVPLFALANAGIAVDGGVLGDALRSPITLGIVAGYALGKPAGILGASWLATRPRLGGLRLPIGWAPLAGGGATAGIGFTVSLLIASLAFHGEQLREAKLGVLGAALAATLLAWLAFRTIALLPPALRVRQLVGAADPLVDLAVPVDPERDHVRGPEDAPVTLVEYGDFECPYCGRAEPMIRALVREFGDDLRFVFRHLPLPDVHPAARLAAEAAEAAAAQGAFWEMHDLLFARQDALRPADLVEGARELELDVGRFTDELRRHVYAPRVAEDVDDADLSGVSGTPTFFVNGRRHHGAYDAATLSAAVRAARARSSVGA